MFADIHALHDLLANNGALVRLGVSACAFVHIDIDVFVCGLFVLVRVICLLPFTFSHSLARIGADDDTAIIHRLPQVEILKCQRYSDGVYAR